MVLLHQSLEELLIFKIEMMGNFSIGDYFRDEVIEFAFELLTSKDWFAIPVEKLYVTIYTNDLDSYNKWIEVGMPKDHIIKLEGNFWEIGEGPGGPDSEIFYDQGEKLDLDGTAWDKFINDEDQDRYVEIWNIVFSQYNCKPGTPREKYEELPHKNIDTGAGLERWACIFQGVESNFETDLFRPIIEKIEELSGVLYNGEVAFKVIADHMKAVTFAISDGASFGNTGRDYVLRRLVRRSVRFGRTLVSIIIVVGVLVNNPQLLQPDKILTIILMILGTIVIYASLFILKAGITFFTTQSLEIMNIFTDGTRDLAQYPLNIYQKWVQNFFTYILPIALVNYYPLLYLIGRTDNKLYMLLPIFTLIFIIPCYAVWKIGIKKYKSTGS